MVVGSLGILLFNEYFVVCDVFILLFEEFVYSMLGVVDVVEIIIEGVNDVLFDI